MPSGYTLAELAAHLDGTPVGGADICYSDVASLEHAKAEHIGFVVDEKHLAGALASQAGALLVSAKLSPKIPKPHVVVDNPRAAFVRAITLFHPESKTEPGIHPSATVAPDAIIAPDVSIGPNAHIGPGTRIGASTRIDASVAIAENVSIGAGCHLYPNASVYHDCVIGDRVILHSGCVIGSDGFGFERDGDHWLKVPQIGRAIIEDDVEIGANTTVDRGALDDTVIERGAKIDNLVQIAHNVRVGANTVIAGCAGIAGSTKIGRDCLIGGAAMILGHIEIGDGVIVSGASFIGKSIKEPGVYTSTQPQMPHADWLKNAAQLRHLADMRERIRALEKKLSEFERKSS